MIFFSEQDKHLFLFFRSGVCLTVLVYSSMQIYLYLSDIQTRLYQAVLYFVYFEEAFGGGSGAFVSQFLAGWKNVWVIES